MSAAVMSHGTISEKTRHSRTRRAMSCAYWAPKSTTRTVGMLSGTLAAHPDALRVLQHLALGLQRRSDHDLGLLERLQVLVSAGRHRGAQAAAEVEGAVVLVGR